MVLARDLVTPHRSRAYFDRGARLCPRHRRVADTRLVDWRPGDLLVGHCRPIEWRFGRPGVSVLGTPITGQYLLARVLSWIDSLRQAFGPMHLATSHIARPCGARAAHRRALCRLRLAPRIEADRAALPHRFGSLSADAVHHAAGAALPHLFPLSLVVGWSVSGYLALFRRPVFALLPVVLAAVTVLPSFFLVGA